MRTRLGVVGGAGFVGVSFAEAALAAGYDVAIIDAADRLGRLSYSGIDRAAKCHFLNPATAAVALPEVDVLVNLAALPHVDYSLYYPEAVATNNTGVHATVLATARSRQIPVLFTSSVEVYGGNEGATFEEDDRLSPLSPYAASKVACESLTTSYQASYGTAVTTVRLTNLFGPWQAPDRIVPRIACQRLLGLGAEASGGRIRDFLFITDAVRALLRIVEAGNWGGTYNLSSGEGVRVEDAAHMVVGDAGQDSLRVVDAPPVDGRGCSLVASPQRLTETFGWKPEVSLNDGIDRTVAWYSENRGWWRRFESLLRSGRDSPAFLVDHAHPIED